MCGILTSMEWPTQKELGERLKELREAAHLTQAEVARRAECDRSLVSRIERGETAPAYDTLVRIARALDVSLAEVFGGTDERRDLPDIRKALRNLNVEVRYGGRVLTDGERERIVDLLDAALALSEEAKSVQSPPRGIIAASMREREAYGRYDPALNAFLDSVIQKALEEYDRRHGGQQHTD
ncbi:MAG: helix-turn-helix transcriptional regulator [Clostridia bacterium]|nr:helix-turn-helix transcriptional regulator [Clostridia bacterium]